MISKKQIKTIFERKITYIFIIIFIVFILFAILNQSRINRERLKYLCTEKIYSFTPDIITVDYGKVKGKRLKEIDFARVIDELAFMNESYCGNYDYVLVVDDSMENPILPKRYEVLIDFYKIGSDGQEYIGYLDNVILEVVDNSEEKDSISFYEGLDYIHIQFLKENMVEITYKFAGLTSVFYQPYDTSIGSETAVSILDQYHYSIRTYDKEVELIREGYEPVRLLKTSFTESYHPNQLTYTYRDYYYRLSLTETNKLLFEQVEPNTRLAINRKEIVMFEEIEYLSFGNEEEMHCFEITKVGNAYIVNLEIYHDQTYPSITILKPLFIPSN